MKILILGSRGMLGSVCEKYLKSKNVEVETFNEYFKTEYYKEYLDKIKSIAPDIIINCIGKIPQKNSDINDYYTANIILPKLLSELDTKILIIHASTDCVFAPSATPMGGEDFSTATDDYGLSKSVGDLIILRNVNCYVIRASIIGTTSSNYSSGLLDWFVRCKSDSVNGYTNHIWNGITTLAWIKFVYINFIDSKRYLTLQHLLHLGSESSVSKYELLNIVNDIYHLNINVIKSETDKSSDRSLKLDISCGSIESQLREFYHEMG